MWVRRSGRRPGIGAQVEIFLDCPACDGRLVFRGARVVGRVRPVGLHGRCPSCGGAFQLLGGRLTEASARPDRHSV